MERLATTTGLYPLPDDAKRELSRRKGHQKHDLISGDEGPEVVGVYERARGTVVNDQIDAGLDVVVEGQLRWDDMLAHPLTVHDAVRTEGIVRYYDNNNFYREPVVEGDLGFSGDVAAELDAASALTDALGAVLPGPFSLADLATDEHYGDDADFLAAVAQFLAGEVAAFPGMEALFLLEPSLAVHPPDGEAAERVVDAVETVADAADAPVVVQPYWGALPEPVYAGLLDADVALGYDLVTAEAANLDLVADHGAPATVSLGVVDGQNTLVETAADVVELGERFVDAAGGAETAYLSTNTELFYLPVNKARAKLDVLGAAATEVPA